MATRPKLEMKPAMRTRRYFSEDFKRKKVEEIDKRLTSVTEICKTYEVSRVAVYKWIYKYSVMRQKAVKMVVEAHSDTVRIQALKERIGQLEQLLGQKQFEIDFLAKQIQVASEQYGIDFKKKRSGKPACGSGKTAKGTATK